MYNYDQDFYSEPSEFDYLVHQFKDSLLKSVKEEFVSDMERLKKENEELQEVKANFQKIKQDYENRKRELSREYETLKTNVRRDRLSELMKDFEVELFTVASKGREQPKCEKCDENRRIYYNTPSGRNMYELCECSTRIPVYEPIPILLSSFSIRRGEGVAWYKLQSDLQDERLSYYDDSISGNQLVTDEQQFDSITYSYKTLFKNIELAQKFCDYKNKKEAGE